MSEHYIEARLRHCRNTLEIEALTQIADFCEVASASIKKDCQEARNLQHTLGHRRLLKIAQEIGEVAMLGAACRDMVERIESDGKKE